MGLDLRGGDAGREGGAVDEERFLLERSVGCEAVGGDVVLKYFELLERRQFCGHCVGWTSCGDSRGSGCVRRRLDDVIATKATCTTEG